MKKYVCFLGGGTAALIFLYAVLSVFFDEAVLLRKGTLYRVNTDEKVVALTFDDGPSDRWTPAILDKLKENSVRATFFMLGEHIKKYPDIVRRLVREGHEAANHTFDHKGLLYYTPAELDWEVKETERVFREVTGQTMKKFFRPPKAWILPWEREVLKQKGYQVVLWTLNSKDWVMFDDKYIIAYILKHVRPGDIILFHDSGGVFGTEGGNRHETVKTIPRLVEKLRERGYRFVTVGELLSLSRRAETAE